MKGCVIEQQLAQKHQEAAEIEARRKGLAAEEEVARQQLALVNNMIAHNAASQLELLEARGRADRLSTQMRETEMSLPRLASAAQELEARLAETQAQFRSEARSALADTRVELQRLQEDLRAEDESATAPSSRHRWPGPSTSCWPTPSAAWCGRGKPCWN